jgi:hypothetical protein
MKMTVLEIESLSHTVAREFGGDVSITGVTAADGEADHAELLIAVSGRGAEPCVIQLNVPRTHRAELERTLRDRFRSLLTEQSQECVNQT